MRYILHYTDPGDIVFDGFCGSGMTGVAAQLCGDRRAVEELGYRVRGGIVYDGERPISRLGARKAVLVDLSPAATFIAYNYNTPADAAAYEREMRRILREVEQECGWMYETWHPHCEAPNRVKGRINYTVWSDVFHCPACGGEVIFWKAAIDWETGGMRDVFPCPHCDAQWAKRQLERAQETVYDRALGQSIQRAKQVPVLISYTVGGRRYEKAPDADDLVLIRRIEESDVPYWFPIDQVPEGDKTADPLSVGITHVHHFWTKRNLWVQAALWARAHSCPNRRCAASLQFWLTAAMRHLTRMSKLGTNYYFHGGGGAVNAGVLGTLYVPSFSVENNVLRTMATRSHKLSRVLHARALTSGTVVGTASSTASATGLDGLYDYAFVDPPFGGNLMYSELNFPWEAWLRVFTNSGPEAVENKVQRKGLADYERLMERCFGQFYRLLKPGRWLTVEFHNSQNAVWNAIQEAMLAAGFVVADVRTFDKRQGTFNQVTAYGAVKQDLIISAYKPRAGFERRFLAEAGSPEGAWDFVRQHLAQVPVVVRGKGGLEVVAERQAYLLYDRMVAFHIQRGATVPLSAAEFYAGLRERFAERDGMYFLPAQLDEYDRARLEAGQVSQLALFVSDEKTAIQWLRQQLDPALGGYPQTYQEIQPAFLQQLHQARHEELPELSEMLEHNFLKDAAGRWYVPDPNQAADLEKLRQKELLRQFAEYAGSSGRLRQVRTEAVRAGFADALKRRDYAVIVRVAERLPEAVLQEDAELLMYYDSATLRVK